MSIKAVMFVLCIFPEHNKVCTWRRMRTGILIELSYLFISIKKVESLTHLVPGEAGHCTKFAPRRKKMVQNGLSRFFKVCQK